MLATEPARRHDVYKKADGGLRLGKTSRQPSHFLEMNLKRVFDEVYVRQALESAWSSDTAVQWSAQNPANGQCNVTAAVINDLYGGDVLRTRYPTFWHYYNRIDGIRVDLTDSQFTRPGARFEAPASYDDEISNLSEAMDGIPKREFDALRKALVDRLASR